MESRMKLTWPSRKTALTPPPWKLNGSSLTPQLLVVQGQPAGPPNGCGLLLTARRPGAPYLAAGGPETPLAVAGSAQRQALRLVVPAGSRSTPTGSSYFSVK